MAPWEEAVDAVRMRAAADRRGAIERVSRHLGSDGVAAIDRLAQLGRLTLNFHPDRIAASGRTVAAGLRHDGCYRSQWATWISNGGRSAIRGGQRHGWEQTLFGGAYDGCDPTVDALPVYGSWDLLGDPHGGSPRFGSSYVVLSPAVGARATFCVGDSHLGPADVGTADELSSVLAGLAEQAAAGHLLGRPLGIAELSAVMEGHSVVERPGRELDHYVEVQIHGGVDLATDVAAIVVDPSFRGSEVERDLASAATNHGFELRWHGGSELAVDDVPDDFRGPTMPGLAAEVAEVAGLAGVAGLADGPARIDAAAIGRAAADLALGPPTPEGDDPAGRAQQLKYLWHTLLAYGSDAVEER